MDFHSQYLYSNSAEFNLVSLHCFINYHIILKGTNFEFHKENYGILLLTDSLSGTVLGQSQLSEVSPRSGKERTTSTTV